MNLVDLDARWLTACVALDQRSLEGLWTEEQWRRELVEPSRLCLGLADGEHLIGVACGWLVVDELHITALAVDPGRRRQGHGRVLLRSLLERALQAGAEHATLEVACDNTAGIALYRGFGFQDAGCRNRYYSDGRDALVQWIRLSELSD